MASLPEAAARPAEERNRTMARLSLEQIKVLLEIGISAFSRKRKVRRVLEELQGAGAHYQDFIAAREAIDAAAAGGASLTLPAEQVAALDFVMDRFSKAAQKMKKRLDS